MEHIRTPKVENVKLIDRFNARNPAVGTLYLTTTHLIFVDPSGKKETWILHMLMSTVEKQPLTTGGSPLQIRCKNFMTVKFIIPKERDCLDIYQSLLKLSQPGHIEELYAFHYTASDDSPKSQGWGMFDLQTEYLRMGVPNDQWVGTNLNKEYEICDTYPRHIFVPASASTPVLVGSSKFRSRGRLPALSYLHRDNQASITRCSQPLAGFSARCMEDEQMLQAILKANPSSKYMYVVDTRPKINAMANKAAGKGYENESFYADIKFQFLGIENIHVMRSSLQKLLELCELKNPTMNVFLSGLESCGWLKHIRAIVETSVFIANAVRNGTSVLVHCSDGWDRTAQTCSLAGMMLDPYYRTIQGFQALIEKEWLAFGHKFTDRCGLLEGIDAKEVSPVLTQFIDTVWQFMQQFPCAFQFNERFLLTLHDHVFSCQFGTFIGNCEKDRIDLRLHDRTYSLWSYLAKNQSDYLNPLYKKEMEVTCPVLIPNTSPQCFQFWRGMYNRFENGVHPRENIMDILSAAKDHSSSLDDHVNLLEKRVTQICKLLGKSEETIQKKLQGFLSVDSLDGILSGALDDSMLPQKTNYDGKSVTGTEHKDTPNGDAPSSAVSKLYVGDSGGVKNHLKLSDSESGFDESSSQMSRSGIEDGSSSIHELHVNANHVGTLTIDQLLAELKTVAIDWRAFRNVRQCNCAAPFDHFSRKYHCWKCGEVFCTRCIARHIPLPGHYSQRPVPVCKPCYLEVKRSPSMEFPSSFPS
ncbi:myotubularin-related protein 8-like isoform X2 [Liolophura sinensis]|uniref:myotubularin-related protein 8-like isoform X2 n=1 Tax=Liolophura sinensis TaxID=3198878 RepID=UPI003158EF8C